MQDLPQIENKIYSVNFSWEPHFFLFLPLSVNNNFKTQLHLNQNENMRMLSVNTIFVLFMKWLVIVGLWYFFQKRSLKCCSGVYLRSWSMVSALLKQSPKHLIANLPWNTEIILTSYTIQPQTHFKSSSYLTHPKEMFFFWLVPTYNDF